MTQRTQYPARLISVHRGLHGPYQVSVRFSLYAVQCVLFQEMSFEQDDWPTSLDYWVNRTINVPLTVSCDWTQLQTETEEVRDGSEWLTATIGLKGQTSVLGPYHTETYFTASYRTRNCLEIKLTDRGRYINDLMKGVNPLRYYRSLKARKRYMSPHFAKQKSKTASA